MLKYVLAWLPMVLIAIVNGAIREGFYGPYLGELRAHQVSTATAIVLFGVYIWVLLRYRMPTSSRQAILIGIVWLGITVAFEFIFMHYIAGHPWEVLLQAYNIFAGRVWVALLVWITIAPYIFYRLQKR